MKNCLRPVCLIFVFCLMLSGCVGTVIETATDATIAIVKIPFKVGGAIIDLATDDDEEDSEDEEEGDDEDEE